MKYLIASDLHGSAYYVKKLVDIIDIENPDHIILLGDILYHGPRNDLPEGYNPKEVICLLKNHLNGITFIKGNCDAEVDSMVLDNCVFHEHVLTSIKGKTIYLTHGHHHNIDIPSTNENYDVMIYGHTHIPLCVERNGKLYLNPGSISIPKENSKHSFIMIKDDAIEFHDLNNDIYQSLKLI